MSFEQYTGSEYWDFPTLHRWCLALCEEHKEWMQYEELSLSREGRPIFLIRIGKNVGSTPNFWLDAGTHASEWTGVMSAVYSLSEWAKELSDPKACTWFEKNSITVVPCVSPDGFQALHEGEPFIRSSRRPPLEGTERVGLDPQDIDGNRKVLLMRWKHPAGPYVMDESASLGVRKRTLQDDPALACFVSQEGLFVEWDGCEWKHAPLKNGIDLNRNFPVHWSPFSMFGMDAGAYSLSEPESRAITDALYRFKNTAAVLSNHTYTGALLSQPYHPDSPLPKGDINLIQELAEQAVNGTDYRVIKVYPDFVYDKSQRIIGVWADFVSSNFGIPAYTLELWDPFRWAGQTMDKPAEFFDHPDQDVIQALLKKAAEEHFYPWTPYDHPQLGKVEIGGFNYFETIRNPPRALLAEECRKGHRIAENLRKSLPNVLATYRMTSLDENTYRLDVMLENIGFLGTSATNRAANLGLAARPKLTLTHGTSHSQRTQYLPILAGWGSDLYKQNLVYPGLSAHSCRAKASWIIQGDTATVEWDAGRGGRGTLHITATNPD
ncbi:MAG: M14 family zinc carboxypeptidase [Myxococcota bacterium]|nr:M14 family zinc carboxypeptidase [Myxococcota bacterium]